MRMKTDLLLASLIVVLGACTEPNPADTGDGSGITTGDAGMRDLSQQPGEVDLSGPPPPLPDLSMPFQASDMSMCPQAVAPPKACVGAEQPDSGFPIQAVVRVDQYDGLISENGEQFEVFDGTVLCTSFVSDPGGVDTQNVQVSMKLEGMLDPIGLPKEIPLTQGQLVEVEGEYIPSSAANVTNDNGPAAIITYTHFPCGFAVIDGMTYLGRQPGH